MNRLVTVRHHPVHQIKAFVAASGLCDRFFGIHGFRFCEDFGMRRVNPSGDCRRARRSNRVEMRNAKVGDGDGEGFPTQLTKETAKDSGSGWESGEGIMFSQRCNGTLAPPISFTSVSQRAWIFSKSGGPNGLSAVPGK